jgi:hypothetical protein
MHTKTTLAATVLYFHLQKKLKEVHSTFLRMKLKNCLKNQLDKPSSRPIRYKNNKKKLEYIKSILNHELLECRCERLILLQKLEQAESYLIIIIQNKTHLLRKLKVAFAE